ncbi:MAG: aldehyde dehydrogenase family protein [Mesorhizobium sp.]|nr:MAG: aldehyde dehydrogenase family protein [Mesorhizobium sp.]
MSHNLQFYIEGVWVDPVVPNNFDVIDPSNEDAFAQISLGTKADVDKAVAAARRAFATFGFSEVEERLDILNRVIEVYKKRSKDLALAVSREMGAPRQMALDSQVGVGQAHLEKMAEVLKTFQFRHVKGSSLIVKEPIGVVGLITPWNWPINQIALKVVPALATGCTCVLKPSEFTPLNAMLYAEMIHEAGFPPGVFNLVNGDGVNCGSALSKHPDVDMMSFTGSTRAGIAVSKDAAETVKRVTLELGGKSPNIVFEDADLEDRVAGSVAECFNNSGQSCDAPTRMLVQRSVYGKAVEIARRVGAAATVGDPAKEGPHIGPVVSDIQYGRVQSLINAAISEGARPIVGGPGKPDGVNKGYFVRPTIFADVDNTMRIAREEVFGPVLVIIPFDTEEDAIEIANDTAYGLAAYIQTRNVARAERVASRLRAGMVHINGAPLRYGSPFGGYKQSGNGREGVKFGLEDFQEVKTIHRPDAA